MSLWICSALNSSILACSTLHFPTTHGWLLSMNFMFVSSLFKEIALNRTQFFSVAFLNILLNRFTSPHSELVISHFPFLYSYKTNDISHNLIRFVCFVVWKAHNDENVFMSFYAQAFKHNYKKKSTWQVVRWIIIIQYWCVERLQINNTNFSL